MVDRAIGTFEDNHRNRPSERENRFASQIPGTANGTDAKLSDRRNIIVIADEAHRSQYDFIDGFARHMRDALPHASFIGFTGTPIEKADANRRGKLLSRYDTLDAIVRPKMSQNSTKVDNPALEIVRLPAGGEDSSSARRSCPRTYPAREKR